MKNRVISLLIPALLVVLTACGPRSGDDGMAPADSLAPDGHNASNSLDWSGVYYGVLPCASCPGIETTVTLNDDMTYSLSTKYQGEQDTTTYLTEGRFAWNSDGNSVTLEGVQDAPNQFFVTEGALYQLDMDGNRVTGDLAENYKLGKKMNASPAWTAGLQDIRWTLVELGGKPVPPAQNQAEQAYITFTADGRVIGNAGCNSFNGGYTMQEGDRIRFSQVARTLKACADMSVETEFMNVLETADNYNLSDSALVLNRARMAPLARFKR